jgi:hypothetical protein
MTIAFVRLEGMARMSSARAGLVAACLAVLPLAGRAQTFDISYSGTDVSGFTYGTTTGSGSFTLAGGVLSEFTFTVEQSAGAGQTDSFTWGLADLDGSFADTLNGDAITALSFTTDSQPGFYTVNTSFILGGLSVGDAETYNADVGALTAGTLTVTPAGMPVPEPAALWVFGIGLLGLAAPGVRQRAPSPG